MSDIVERLRYGAEILLLERGGILEHTTLTEAAVAIEARDAEIERLRRELIEQRQPDVIIRSAMLLAAFREENAGKVGDLRAAAVMMFGEEAVQRATDWFDPGKEKP